MRKRRSLGFNDIAKTATSVLLIFTSGNVMDVPTGRLPNGTGAGDTRR